MQELAYFVVKSTGRVQKWNKWAMKNDDQPIRDMEKWCHDDDDLIYEHIYTTLWSQHTFAREKRSVFLRANQAHVFIFNLYSI